MGVQVIGGMNHGIGIQRVVEAATTTVVVSVALNAIESIGTNAFPVIDAIKAVWPNGNAPQYHNDIRVEPKFEIHNGAAPSAAPQSNGGSGWSTASKVVGGVSTVISILGGGAYI